MRVLTVLFVSIAMLGAAHAKKATFNSIPANIADAPVDDFLHVERRDVTHVYRWKATIPGGSIWIAHLWGGRYWPEWRYSSKRKVLDQFRNDNFENFRRVTSTAFAGSQWGYMALAEWRDRRCVVGVVMDNDNHVHDGGAGRNSARLCRGLRG